MYIFMTHCVHVWWWLLLLLFYVREIHLIFLKVFVLIVGLFWVLDCFEWFPIEEACQDKYSNLIGSDIFFLFLSHQAAAIPLFMSNKDVAVEAVSLSSILSWSDGFIKQNSKRFQCYRILYHICTISQYCMFPTWSCSDGSDITIPTHSSGYRRVTFH